MLVHERDIGGEPTQVGSGAEYALVRGGQHDTAHGSVVPGGAESFDQLPQELVGQRVARVRLVQRDSGDALVGDVV